MPLEPSCRGRKAGVLAGRITLPTAEQLLNPLPEEELAAAEHPLLWWLAEPDRLSPAAHLAINDPANSVHVSAASGWEIATKVSIGKLPGIGDLLSDLPELLNAQDFDLLPITLQQGMHAGSYPIPHRDPYRCTEDCVYAACWPPRLSWPCSRW